VKMGVAKKLEGQADSPINHGGLCARGQAAIQITYHPDRITQPMKRSGARGSGDFKPVSWDEAIAELVSHLDALAASGDQKSLAYVARPRPNRRMVLAAEFVVGFGAPAPYGFEPFDDRVLRLANAMSWAKEQLATVDLARARFVISFGADFLGTWNSPVAQSFGYGAMRQARPGVRGAIPEIDAGVQRACEAVAGPPVDRSGIQLIACAVVLARFGAQTVILHLRRPFVLRVDVDERVLRTAQAIHLQLAVDEQCASQRAANRGPCGQSVVEQIRAPVTDAEGLPLARTGAGEKQLPSVVALAGLDSFDQPAIHEAVGPGNERILSLRPFDQPAIDSATGPIVAGRSLLARMTCARPSASTPSVPGFTGIH